MNWWGKLSTEAVIY